MMIRFSIPSSRVAVQGPFKSLALLDAAWTVSVVEIQIVYMCFSNGGKAAGALE
jgi:hypothetical protein